MKITTTREQLLGPLQKISGVVERRQTLPILANVLMSTSNGQLAITATDLEVEMKTTGSCESDGELDFTLPARKLLDICKALPEGAQIELNVEGERAVLRSGRGRYALGLLPAQDYPAIEATEGENSFEIAQNTLKELLEKTQFAMAQQDVRYYLNGLLLETRDGLMRAVATDGHRLAMNEAEAEIPKGLNLRLILPRKAVMELYRLLADTERAVRLETSANHIRFHIDDSVFTSKLIDGRFPDYERVVPAKGAIFVKADRDTLRQSLLRTSILSNEKYRGIRFQLSEGLLHLIANNPEQEEAEEEVEVEFQGSEITIGFNVGYLLDVLGVIDTEMVTFSLTDPNSSCLVQADPPDKGRYVIMPMRL
jgi:DNA polymerase-3 subunit beta